MGLFRGGDHLKPTIDSYAGVAGGDVVDHLRQLASPLEGLRVVHVNSTRTGGGVAEILTKLVPLMSDLGLDATWEVIEGEDGFFRCTKMVHNALQHQQVEIGDDLWRVYEETNAANADALRDVVAGADVVFVHDPQPAALINYFPKRQGRWVWRCHIDISQPYRRVWRILRRHVAGYDASIFSMVDFAQPLPHPQYLIPPSIDPLSPKNVELPRSEIDEVIDRFGIDASRPLVVQVSRFDRFKDPLGVIRAYRLSKEFVPGLQLVLAGGGASDDPEGDAVLSEVRAAVGEDPDVHVLLLPPDDHRTINALQRAADIVVQKSTKEGFGLTVTEAMWKGKPVIGGNVGGIRLQVVNHQTGFLVDSPEGAALRIRYLLHHRGLIDEMGKRARAFVRDNYLITRHLREYLTLIHALNHPDGDLIEIR